IGSMIAPDVPLKNLRILSERAGPPLFFHQSVANRRAFRLGVRRHRFSPSITGPWGFTPASGIKDAMRFLLLSHVEFSGLLAAPLRLGLPASPPYYARC
ncbi:hypothetical protein, partial [Burkholderia ubonensis]|uniref:hypothetical protein n=1 Tax=Burkholderia ubonensis TaxID=101571 RepID=UPI001E50CEDB